MYVATASGESSSPCLNSSSCLLANFMCLKFDVLLCGIVLYIYERAHSSQRSVVKHCPVWDVKMGLLLIAVSIILVVLICCSCWYFQHHISPIHVRRHSLYHLHCSVASKYKHNFQRDRAVKLCSLCHEMWPSSDGVISKYHVCSLCGKGAPNSTSLSIPLWKW